MTACCSSFGLPAQPAIRLRASLAGPDGQQWQSMLNAPSNTVVAPGDNGELARGYADADSGAENDSAIAFIGTP